MQDPFKTLSSLRNHFQVSRSKSMNNFVLLNKNRQNQENYRWQHIRTRENLLQERKSQIKQFTYSQKKSILSNLQSQNFHLRKDNKINSQATMQTFLKSKFDLSQKQIHKEQKKPFLSKKNSIDEILIGEARLKNFTSTHNNFNVKANNIIKRKIGTTDQTYSKNTQNLQSLQKRVQKASLQKRRLITVFTIRRYGLRIRLNNVFISICLCKNQKHDIHKLENNLQMNQLVKEMFPSPQNINQSKRIYYFDVNKEPIFNIQQIGFNMYTIIASSSPRLEIEEDFTHKLHEETNRIKNNIMNIQRSLKINYNQAKDNLEQQYFYRSPRKVMNKQMNQNDDDDYDDGQSSTNYDWQIIQNVDNYVDKICSNPELIHEKKEGKLSPLKTKVREWFKQSFSSQQSSLNKKKVDKNPILQGFNHYPNQIKDKKLLSKISQQLQQFDFINNTHIINRFSVGNGLQKAKKQRDLELKQQQAQKSNPLKRNIENNLTSKPSILKKLDDKHNLLSEQNVPYMMHKYGISRYEIHNLYSLYKTLEKISALRMGTKVNRVVKRGIDKNTFDQGMKKLDINPGEEVIRNICIIDDFISWEQFIKIISIGLRKTPQQKLQAVLSGVISINQGLFTKKHISIMIGSSLSKIFDSQQPELKQYFTEVAMLELDEDKSGTIEVQQLKKKILSTDPQNQNLVKFLLLNS